MIADRVYGFKRIPDQYPRFSRLEIRGDKAIVRFTGAEDGLMCKNPAGLKGFAIAGTDRNFVWAEAAIRGKTVEIWSPKVPAPVAVRYAWADNPEVSLFSKAGLPAAPLRSDDWPAVKITNPRASP